jgi:hypothetical protein
MTQVIHKCDMGDGAADHGGGALGRGTTREVAASGGVVGSRAEEAQQLG